jgi:hypothetical protein
MGQVFSNTTNLEVDSYDFHGKFYFQMQAKPELFQEAKSKNENLLLNKNIFTLRQHWVDSKP